MSDFFWAKIECIGATLTVVSFAAIVLSCHIMPSLYCWSESHCTTRPTNSCERDYDYSCFLNGKKIKITCLQLVASKL